MLPRGQSELPICGHCTQTATGTRTCTLPRGHYPAAVHNEGLYTPEDTRPYAAYRPRDEEESGHAHPPRPAR